MVKIHRFLAANVKHHLVESKYKPFMLYITSFATMIFNHYSKRVSEINPEQYFNCTYQFHNMPSGKEMKTSQLQKAMAVNLPMDL